MLDAPTRDDDLEPLIAAIRQLRGVADVRMVESDVVAEHVAERRVRLDVAEELRELADRVTDGEARRG